MNYFYFHRKLRGAHVAQQGARPTLGLLREAGGSAPGAGQQRLLQRQRDRRRLPEDHQRGERGVPGARQVVADVAAGRAGGGEEEGAGDEGAGGREAGQAAGDQGGAAGAAGEGEDGEGGLREAVGADQEADREVREGQGGRSEEDGSPVPQEHDEESGEHDEDVGGVSPRSEGHRLMTFLLSPHLECCKYVIIHEYYFTHFHLEYSNFKSFVSRKKHICLFFFDFIL